MATASAAMASVGQAANLPAMQKTMQQFAKENAKMDMASEMMDDAVDDAMDDDEEEADDVMNQVSTRLISLKVTNSKHGMCKSSCNSSGIGLSQNLCNDRKYNCSSI